MAALSRIGAAAIGVSAVLMAAACGSAKGGTTATRPPSTSTPNSGVNATEFDNALSDWARGALTDITAAEKVCATTGTDQLCKLGLAQVGQDGVAGTERLASNTPVPTAYSTVPTLLEAAVTAMQQAASADPAHAEAPLTAAESALRSVGTALGVVLPTPTATPEPSPALGQAITTTTGVVITVSQYVDHFSSGNPYETPSNGFWAAVMVRVCAGDDTLFISPAQFRVQEPDDTQLEEAISVKDPAFNVTNLQPHQCVAGWISYDVPAKPKAVLLQNTDLSWVIP